MTVDHLFFSYEALTDILMYCDAAGNDEICGIGRVVPDAGDILYVKEIKILPQDVSSGTVLVKEEDLTPFFENLPEGHKPEEWCFNWHSHVNMGVSPSGTDTDNYAKFNEMFDLFIPAIFNKKNQFNAWAYWQKPIAVYHKIDKIWLHELKKDYRKIAQLGLNPNQDQMIPFLLYMAEKEGLRITDERREFIKEEVRVNVRKKYAASNYSYGGYGGYQNNSNTYTPTNYHTNNQNVTGRKDLVTSPSNQQKTITVGSEGKSDADTDEKKIIETKSTNTTNLSSELHRSIGKTGKTKSVTDWTVADKWIDEFDTIQAFITAQGLKEDEDGDFFDAKTGEGYTYQELCAIVFPESDKDKTVAQAYEALDMDLMLDEFMENLGYVWSPKMGCWENTATFTGQRNDRPLFKSQFQAVEWLVMSLRKAMDQEPQSYATQRVKETSEERELIEFMTAYGYEYNRVDYCFYPLNDDGDGPVVGVDYYKALDIMKNLKKQYAERWAALEANQETKPSKNGLQPHEYKALYKYMEKEGYVYEKEAKRFWWLSDDGVPSAMIQPVSLNEAIEMYKLDNPPKEETVDAITEQPTTEPVVSGDTVEQAPDAERETGFTAGDSIPETAKAV